MSEGIGVRFVQPLIMQPMPLARQHRWRLFFDNQMGTFVLQHTASGRGCGYSHGMDWITASDIEKHIRSRRKMTQRVKGRLIRKARRIQRFLVPVAVSTGKSVG